MGALRDQFWGDRTGTFTDPHGYMWTVATHKEDLTPDEIAQGLNRHAAADWAGDLAPDDRYGGRLFSAHGRGDRRFWIITECDRSVTTVLMPEEY